MRRLRKRKFNGISFKKGEREELWAGKPVMPREYFSGKYDKNDEVVSKHVEGSSPWKRWRPAAPSAVSISVNTWMTQ